MGLFLADKVEMGLAEYTCGSLGDIAFSGTFPFIVSTAILIIMIAVPVLLIIFGMLDLGKAVVASKEDEIKKAQGMFVKRLISAVLVFFVIAIVKIVIRFVSNNNSTVANCFNCFVNGEASENACKTYSEL